MLRTLALVAAITAVPVARISRQNPPMSRAIEGSINGTYDNDGVGRGSIRLTNNSRFAIRFFIRFPGETHWRETVSAEAGPRVDSLVSKLPGGVYEVAAQRRFNAVEGYWNWGPVRLRVKRRAKWTVRL